MLQQHGLGRLRRLLQGFVFQNEPKLNYNATLDTLTFTL